MMFLLKLLKHLQHINEVQLKHELKFVEDQQFQVSKSTQVEFAALERFEMFYDYECTQPMEWIDVSQNDLTVYITLDPTKAE